jgi:hypothetical protein
VTRRPRNGCDDPPSVTKNVSADEARGNSTTSATDLQSMPDNPRGSHGPGGAYMTWYTRSLAGYGSERMRYAFSTATAQAMSANPSASGRIAASVKTGERINARKARVIGTRTLEADGALTRHDRVTTLDGMRCFLLRDQLPDFAEELQRLLEAEDHPESARQVEVLHRNDLRAALDSLFG